MCSPMPLHRRGPRRPPPKPPPASMARAKPALEPAQTNNIPPERSVSFRLAPVDHHDVLAHAAVVVGEADRGVGHLARARVAAQLGPDLRGLRDTGGAERMAASDQAAARVHDDVAAVVAAPRG